MSNSSHHFTIYRLTALWALCESGLGGIMHALKIPFTGFFVGGFAILIIGMIAFYSTEILSKKNTSKNILQATLLVCFVKAAVSPQSPIGAYLAVAFQGLAGSLLYRFISFKAASIVLGMLAMLESALQKLLMLTIVFGKSLWQAIDIFVTSILHDFSLPANFSFSIWLALFYCLIHTIWGLLLGFWIGRLPSEIRLKTPGILSEYTKTEFNNSNFALKQKKVRFKWVWLMLPVMLFIAWVLIISGFEQKELMFILLRTISVIIFLIYILQPFIKWLTYLFIKNKQKQSKEQVKQLIDTLHDIRQLILPAYTITLKRKKGWRKYKEFVIVLFVLSIHELKSNG